jgi:Flp pilus assembly pilin Flp
MIRRRSDNPSGPRRQQGSAVVEYAIITFFVVVVLITQDNVIAQVMQAIKDMYEAFSFAISMTFPTPD